MRKTRAPESWTPILHGSVAAQAWKAIRDIAAALRGPQEFRGPEYSLVEGRTGLAVFFAYLALATEEDEAREQAYRLVEEVVDGIDQVGATPGLMFGFPGVAWTVEHLEGRIWEPGEEDLNEAVDAALLQALSSGKEAWDGAHDLMFGLAGLGVYGLERLPRASGRQIVEGVVDMLDATARRDAEGLWWASTTDGMPPDLRRKFPDGVYSLGVSHGTPGTIGFLGGAYRAGVQQDKVEQLLRGAVAWLMTHRQQQGRGSSFANWVSEDPQPTRTSWCYGNAGIAPTLMTAGRSTGRQEWAETALELAVEAAGRSFEDCGVVDAGFCHGAAGVGHLLNRMFQSTGEQRLQDAAGLWFAKALGMKRAGTGLGGFMSYREAGNEPDPTPSLMTDPGMLTGVAGIGLALLAAVSPVKPEWDRIFLASDPGPSA